MSSSYSNVKPNIEPARPPVGGATLTRLWPLWAVAATVGAGLMWGVFTLYTSPDFMVDMANQLWSCF